MSVFTNTQVTPSRMLGILRLLASFDNEGVSKGELRDLWWPRTDRNESTSVSYFADNLRELEAAGLVSGSPQEEGLIYTLGPAFGGEFPSPEEIADAGPDLFLQALFSDDKERNGDLGHILAWWLAQPLEDAPSKPQELATTLRTAVDFDRLEWRSEQGNPITVNEARARQVVLWLTYLGLGWEHGKSPTRSSTIQVDPSSHLRRQFRRHLPGEEGPMRIKKVWDTISRESPFLKGGEYRQNLERAGLLTTETNRFSQSVSLALRRLHGEGCIRLIEQSDASSRHLTILTWGNESPSRVSHVSLPYRNRG